MYYKIVDLETEISYLYQDRGFCVLIGMKERNFLNRWRNKKTIGLVFDNKWYIKEITLCK